MNNAPVQAVYLATFDRSKRLPGKLKDTTLWYPVNDAAPESNNHYDPLQTEPRVPGAQWVNVRKPHLVEGEKVFRCEQSSFQYDVLISGMFTRWRELVASAFLRRQ